VILVSSLILLVAEYVKPYNFPFLWRKGLKINIFVLLHFSLHITFYKIKFSYCAHVEHIMT